MIDLCQPCYPCATTFSVAHSKHCLQAILSDGPLFSSDYSMRPQGWFNGLKPTGCNCSILFLLIMVACAACGAWIVRQMVNARHEQINYARKGQLYSIGLGVSAYLHDHGHLPDPIIHSPSGVASSWRVHVIRHFDGGDLYNAYDFRQPWNGPTNLSLANIVPQYYQDPGMHSAPATTFTLIRLSKQNTQVLFPSFAPHVTDDCVAVVSIINAYPPFVWTEPRDICYNDLRKQLLHDAHSFVLLVADSGYYDVIQPEMCR